jgi:hypothetical protein
MYTKINKVYAFDHNHSMHLELLIVELEKHSHRYLHHNESGSVTVVLQGHLRLCSTLSLRIHLITILPCKKRSLKPRYCGLNYIGLGLTSRVSRTHYRDYSKLGRSGSL